MLSLRWTAVLVLTICFLTDGYTVMAQAVDPLQTVQPADAVKPVAVQPVVQPVQGAQPLPEVQPAAAIPAAGAQPAAAATPVAGADPVVAIPAAAADPVVALPAVAVEPVVANPVAAAQPGAQTVQPDPVAAAKPDAANPAQVAPCQNLQQVLAANNLTIMQALLAAANYTLVLNEALPLTLIVPTNAAFLNRAAQLGIDPVNVAATPPAKILPILQYHVIRGSTVDFTDEQSYNVPLSTDLPFSPCVTGSPVTFSAAASADGDVLINGVQGQVRVVDSFRTCNNVSAIYVVDDVMLPCCTDFFDMLQSPLISEVAKSVDGGVQQFWSFFAEQIYVNGKWQLPPTVFLPTAAAMQRVLPSLVGKIQPGQTVIPTVSANVLKILVSFHMYGTPTPTLAAQLGVKPVEIDSILQAGVTEDCQHKSTLTQQNNGITVWAGNNSAPVVESFQLCGNTSLHIIDGVLVPCELEKLFPCKQIYEVINNPDLLGAFTSTDPEANATLGELQSLLVDAHGNWSVPPVVFVPSEPALAQFLSTFTYPGPPTEARKRAFWKAMAAYHIGITQITPQIMRSRNATQITTMLTKRNIADQQCQRAVTLEPGFLPGSRPAAVDPANTVADSWHVVAGSTSANVLKVYSLCNSTIFMLDNVLVPCSVDELVPCVEFYELASDDIVTKLFSSNDVNAKKFFGALQSELVDDLGKWNIPPTVFIPSPKSLQKALSPFARPGDEKYGKYSAALFKGMALYHVSDQFVDINTTSSKGLAISTNLGAALGSSARSCQATVTVMPGGLPDVVTATDTDTPPIQYHLVAGNNSVNVLASYKLCGKRTVALLDDVMVPCHMEELLPCKDFWEVEDSPQIASILNSTDPLVKAFGGILQQKLVDKLGKWRLPKTMFLPNVAALSAFLQPYAAADNNVFNKYAKRLYAVLVDYHISVQALNTTKFTEPIVLDMNSDPSLAACQRQLMVSEVAASSQNKGIGYVVRAGNNTATIVGSQALCNSTIYFVDQVLIPCQLRNLLPCTEFYELQREPALAGVMNSTNLMVKAFMNTYLGYIVSGATTLPATIIIPTEDAIIKGLQPLIRDTNPVTEARNLFLYKVLSFFHLSDDVIVQNRLAAAPDGAFNLTTWLSVNSSLSCQTTVQLHKQSNPVSVMPEAASKNPSRIQLSSLMVTSTETTANVIQLWQLCGNISVFLVNKLLLPCQLESFLPCRQYYDLQQLPALVPFFNSTQKHLVAFRNWQAGKLYVNKEWHLPGTLFIPDANATASWLQQNIGRLVWTGFAKAAYEGLSLFSISDQKVDPDVVQAEGSVTLSNFLQARLQKRTACDLSIKMVYDNATDTIKVQAGGSEATVIDHYLVCNGGFVYVLDNALLPCNSRNTMDKLKSGSAAVLPAVVLQVVGFLLALGLLVW